MVFYLLFMLYYLVKLVSLCVLLVDFRRLVDLARIFGSNGESGLKFSVSNCNISVNMPCYRGYLDVHRLNCVTSHLSMKSPKCLLFIAFNRLRFGVIWKKLYPFS